MECKRCGGRGWYPEVIEDENDPGGCYEGREKYCDCEAGDKLRQKDRN